MVFSDTSTRQGLIQDSEDLLGLGATGISSSTVLLQTFTRNINSWYHKVASMILASQDNWDWDDTNNTDYAVATTPLVANQRDYAFPGSLKILKIKRADITYDGTTWYQLFPMDSGTYPDSLGNDTTVDARFNTSLPRYDARGNSLWIYPRATASVGTLRIEFLRQPTEFTTASTTTEPGFDKPWHRMLSLGAAFDYASAKALPQKGDLWTQLQDYEARLKQFYGKKDLEDGLGLNSMYGTSYGR